MNKAGGKLTVYFDAPFWVGVFERIRDGRLSAAKVTFGAEPSEQEICEFVLTRYAELQFSPTVSITEKEAKSNPKKIRREARSEVLQTGIGTKSQQALKLQYEQNKQEHKVRSREEKEAEAERRFELKEQKKKEKHRGR